MRGWGLGGAAGRRGGQEKNAISSYVYTHSHQLWPPNLKYFLLPLIFTTGIYTFIPTYS